MDPVEVRAAYDEHLRRRADPGPRGRLEVDGPVVRVVAADPGDTEAWQAVLWSDLDGLAPARVDAVVAAQVERFAGTDWEWKLHSYDAPTDLPRRLVAAGLAPEQEEALMVAEISDLDLDVRPPDGVRLEPVTGPEGAARLVAVHDAVFGGDHASVGRRVLEGLAADPPTTAAVVASAGDLPVSSGRLELHHGTPFASIWGGGTLPEWRGRGVFRALVAHRSRVAADAGFRWLQVDALPPSRPILARLGFVELGTTTPYAPGRAR
ncbi:GNAT family N-acetyltransferase [Lapillicoccus jejuensis]|uniref:N-acetyltransferase domain-containing protein n=1 Tax=Lapillicoccus jejuensis TaxID=402171 RepID=A0A542DZQ2_9MICO|nr:GNAT family N-acetyltransferase [Lapillicoccus jejuensis]TQJ08519.1 hypothetical protein FB458_1609 [Lapillicoccus jejuensis]